MRSVLGERHRFLAAGDDDRGIAAGDLLRAERHGSEPAAANLIDREGGLFLRDTGLHRRLARGILALGGGQNLAENNFIDVGRVDLGALDRRLERDGAEIMRSRIGECSIEGADRSSGGADDDDIAVGHERLLRKFGFAHRSLISPSA